MSYVDAVHDTKNDVVTVIERVDGKRVFTELKPIYNFYYADPYGKKRSIYGEPVTEVKCSSQKDFRKILGKEISELDPDEIKVKLNQIYDWNDKK